jgi:hypothetical protein
VTTEFLCLEAVTGNQLFVRLLTAIAVSNTTGMRSFFVLWLYADLSLLLYGWCLHVQLGVLTPSL